LSYLNNYAVTSGTSFTVLVGAGGAGSNNGSFGTGGAGAVRIVWPGSGRLFPSTVVTQS
jgi:hypothetical protein